jgi:hypothetical protein
MKSIERIDSKLENRENAVFKVEIEERNNLVTSTSSKTNNDDALLKNQPVVGNRVNECRKIAGVWKQFYILLWKNFILSKRNLCGLFTELLCPLVAIIILIIIRYFVDITQYSDQSNGLNNVLDLLRLTKNSGNLLLYYPNTTLAKSVVEEAVMLIQKVKSFNITSI